MGWDYQTGKAHHEHCESNHQLSHIPEKKTESYILILEWFSGNHANQVDFTNSTSRFQVCLSCGTCCVFCVFVCFTCCAGTYGRSGGGWRASTWKTLEDNHCS